MIGNGIERPDVWTKIAADLPRDAYAWRQDGKPSARDGKYFARFVVYVEAGTVRERLDSVVPGEWDLTLELLPASPYQSEDEATVNFKARLQILGVIREDVGTGKDYKSAATDAFKRAAVRFGIGHELYAFDQNWVQVDGDGKFAKPVEDPQKAYERRHASGAKPAAGIEPSPAPREGAAPEPTGGPTRPPALGDEPWNPTCPKCGGKMWDNRIGKRNPKAPDAKCQNRSCDGVIWPEKGKQATDARPANTESADQYPGALVEQLDDLPF